MINGVSSVGLAGIQNGQYELLQAANKITTANKLNDQKYDRDEINDMASSMVTQIKSIHKIEASIQVLKAGNQFFDTVTELVGNEIDIKA